jgi:hypothetical protein
MKVTLAHKKKVPRLLISVFPFSIRRGMEANQILRSQFSSAVSIALDDVNIANKDLLSSIDSQYLILQSHYYIDFKFVS